MTRKALIAALLAAGGTLASVPASATPGNNPNAVQIVDVRCDDGTEFAELWAVPPGRALHHPDGRAVAVLMSLSVFLPRLGWVPLSDPAPPGLSERTVTCTWINVTHGGFLLRGEVLLTGRSR